MRGILTYHSIDESGSPISVPPAVFRQHAEWLASGRVRVVPLDRIQQASERDAVALTFDDGFDNFATIAWPTLRDQALPVTLFLVTDHVGRTNDWAHGATVAVPTLPLLGWDELGRLAGEGLALGSHTRTHPNLAELDAGRLADEIIGSAERIERVTGVRPRAFAYPYGRHNREVADVVGQAYEHACTTELHFVRSSDPPHLLPRIDVFYCRRPGRLESWGSPAFRGRMAVRQLLRRLRARLA